jgi:hypothetical protein
MSACYYHTTAEVQSSLCTETQLPCGGDSNVSTFCRRQDKFASIVQTDLQMTHFGLNDNAAQVVVLRPLHPHTNDCPDIVVGNVHILFNQKRGDTKLGQVRTPLSHMFSPSCAALRTPFDCLGTDLDYENSVVTLVYSFDQISVVLAMHACAHFVQH